MKAAIPTTRPDWFHLVEIDGDDASIRPARYINKTAANAEAALWRANELHGIAAIQERDGIDPAFTDALIAKVAR